MDNGEGSDFILQFNGIGSPQINSYVVTNLSQGKPYRFKLLAYNYNGPSAESDIATFRACEAPRNFGRPQKKITTASSITI